MTFSWQSALSMLIVLPLLGACGDKRSANADNFQRALQDYFGTHPECGALPIDLSFDAPISANDPHRRQLEAMTGVGLLSATPASAAGATQYSVTAAGNAAIRKGDDPFLGGMSLCYAHRRVVKVTSFTAPADALGIKMSRVTYQYDLRDIVPWSKAEAVQEAFPQIKASLAAQNQTDTEPMVLTSEGWVDEHVIH